MASSGNFCTWNPLRVNQQTQTFAEGNTRFSSTQTSTNPAVTGTFGVTSGKWYWEIKIVNYGNASNSVGVCRTSAGLETDTGALWNATGDVVFMYLAGGNKRTNGSSSSYGNSWTTGDILQVALDMDNGAVYFGKNNTFQNSGDPTSGASKTGAGFTNLADKGHIQPYSLVYNNGDQVINCGQDSTFGGRETAGGNADANGFGDFAYAPPSGYLALCSANLPVASGVDPNLTDDNYPGKQFFISQYAGNLTARTITTEAQPDLIFIRSYDNQQNWYVVDSSRGITANKYLITNSTGAEATFPQSNFTSVSTTSVGISAGTWLNSTGANYQMWMWKCNGGTTATNTQGTITSTVQANQDAGFSICTYTGNGSAGATFGHGLSAKPSFVIIKNRDDGTQKWAVWHQSADMTDYQLLFLNTNAGKTTEGTQRWDVSAISSSVFGLGSHNEINGSNNDDYIAYIWHDIEGMQKFGSFEGNSNADGPYVHLGFRPRLVFCKAIDATENWQVRDTARSTFNANSQVRIYWNSDSAQGSASTASPIDFLSSGFKVRGSNSEINSNTIIYGAWGDASFKYQSNTF